MIRKTISIPDAMDEWVKAQIADGRYGSDSEYFRDLIRRDQDSRRAEVGLRALLDAEGVLFVVEPRASDRLEDNCNPIATMYYGFSVFHCMTQSLASGGPGLGTCMGPTRTEALMREAGFTGFEMLDIRSQVLSFYAVRP